MHKVIVPLGDRSYPILIGPDLLKTIGKQCASLKFARRCAVITDTTVERHYAKPVLEALRRARFDPVLISVPPGENSKKLSVVQTCFNRLADHRIERNSFIVALGGGVVGDLAGFVAATYLRGIGFVQVPTSLLAQVDSSVGGKVGVNLPAGKNLVGSFYQPRLVLCDLHALKTLPQRELRSGIAEIIKYGIIYDHAFFERLERQMPKLLGLQPKVSAEIIARCCEIKAEVVSLDEREGGVRAILNFGHTLGHAIEAVYGYGTFLHGEAIAVGQIAAAKLSMAQKNLPKAESDRIETLIRRVGLPAAIPINSRQKDRLLRTIALDKKVVDGKVGFVLAEKIGKVAYGQQVPTELIERTLGDLAQDK